MTCSVTRYVITHLEAMNAVVNMDTHLSMTHYVKVSEL